MTNPTLIVEVSSPSTEQYDRGEKFNHYSQIPSLAQYVLVSHAERRIEVWTRDGTPGWARRLCRDGDVAELGCVNAQLDVNELYDAVTQPRV